MRFTKFAVLSTLTFATVLLFSVSSGATGSISGQVKLEHEVAVVPVVDVTVSAIPADSHFVRTSGVVDTHLIATTRTDSSGNYRLENLPAGNYYVVACKMDLGCLFYDGAYGSPHLKFARAVTVTDGEETSGINITFQPFVPPSNPALITGQITDAETGAGIANAWVGASGEMLTIIFETRTGPDGRYELPVPAGGYFVRAAAPGYQPGEYPGNPVRVEAHDTAANVDIALRPGIVPDAGVISGRITDSATGFPLPSARVLAFIVRDNVFPRVYETLSDTDGGYWLRVPPDSDYHVFAEKPGYQRGEYPGNPVAVGPNDTVRGIDIALNPSPEPPLGYITGRITDAATGNGISEAHVVAKTADSGRPIFETRTGPDGYYRLAVWAGDLQPEEYHVWAAARGYETAPYPGNPVFVSVGETVPDVNIALRPISIGFGSISGQVTNAADGAPISHALVVARQQDGFGYGTALTDSGGHYRLGPLPAGFYKVAALARGFFPSVYPEPVEVRAGENTPDINFRLSPVPPPDLGTISGMVSDDPTGEPIGCAVVAAVGFDSVFRHRIVRFAHTDSTGNYVIEGLPKIPYFVIAWARGYFAEIYDNVRRFENATKVTPDAAGINFALERKDRDSTALSLTGTIQSGANLPLGGAFVQATDAGGTLVGSALSLPDGGFILDGLAPGGYTLSASLEAASGSQYVDVSGGSISGISLMLPAGTSLRGDLNGDGRFTPSDAAYLIKAVFVSSTDLADWRAADVNCDGRLTPSDLAIEIRLVYLNQLSGVCGF